jgi:hypothetical protein
MYGQENSLVITLDGSRLELGGPASYQALNIRGEESHTCQQRYWYFSAMPDHQAVPV